MVNSPSKTGQVKYNRLHQTIDFASATGREWNAPPVSGVFGGPVSSGRFLDAVVHVSDSINDRLQVPYEALRWSLDFHWLWEYEKNCGTFSTPRLMQPITFVLDVKLSFAVTTNGVLNVMAPTLHRRNSVFQENLPKRLWSENR